MKTDKRTKIVDVIQKCKMSWCCKR